MEKLESIIAIVPDSMGATALAQVPGLLATVVAPGDPVPNVAQSAEILVVGPAEKQSEVDDALRQIAQLPNLKLIQTLGQGVEQWEGRLPDGVRLLTARGAHGGSAAEWAVMAVLALMRELPFYLDNQRKHSWNGRRARTLQASRVLIYGASDLGQNIRSRLQPFGAKLTMVGTHAREDIIDAATARTHLSTTDVVILALPLTAETRGMVYADLLASLPNGAIVVNVGRGGLIDQPALVNELHNGRLQAALDVVTPEPLPLNDPLWDVPGLILTPHVAGNTDGADERAWAVAAKNIADYLKITS